jgi:hypothetical protein
MQRALNREESMRQIAIGVVLFLSTASFANADCSHGRRGEEVGRIPSSFMLTYKDGTKESIIIKYVGQASLDVSQSGRSSNWRHPVDTRRCNWSTEATVTRQLCIVSKSLGEQCQGNLTKVFYIAGAGKGHSVNPVRLNFQGENCNRACGKFNGDYNAAKAAVTASLNGIYEQDFKPFLEQIKQRPDVSNIAGQ